MKESIWKMVTVGLLSAAATGFTSWMSFGLTRVSYAEMQSYVQERITVSEMSTNIGNQPAVLRLAILENKLNSVLEKLDRVEKKIDGKPN